ncbi:MAG: S-layer homology domain-containing protein [Egibacteraceae bacterium]
MTDSCEHEVVGSLRSVPEGTYDAVFALQIDESDQDPGDPASFDSLFIAIQDDSVAINDVPARVNAFDLGERDASVFDDDGDPNPDPGDGFEDVPSGTVHSGAIDRLTETGVAQGTTETTYSPARTVSRAQLVTFASRLFHAIVYQQHCADQSPRPAACDAFVGSDPDGWAVACQGTWIFQRSETCDAFYGLLIELCEGVPAWAAGEDLLCRNEVRADISGSQAIVVTDGYEPSFDDTGAHTLGPSAELGVELGITRGCGAGRFCPNAGVTRAQMATFLARLLGIDGAPRTTEFVDVNASSVHAGNIAALAEAGITQGCGANRFCPDDVVRRDQMASFLIRTFDEVRPPSPSTSASR